MAFDSLAVQTVRSITTIKKAASSASLVLGQRGDGSYFFVNTLGQTIAVTGSATIYFDDLYAAIDALV